MIAFVHKQLKRFFHALSGIVYAARHDTSFKTQLFGGLLFLAVFTYLVWPLTTMEAFFLVLAFTVVLITELQNSSYEAALDRLHPDLHEEIGKSKDMAAGAVLLAGLFALVVVTSIVIARLMA